MSKILNPFAGRKTAFMHEDARSSDVFAGRAPGENARISFTAKNGTVPTILLGTDGLLQVICVRNDNTGNRIARTPYLLLLDPKTLETLATLKLPAGRALNNIYGYLNSKDELLLANGATIYRIQHTQKGAGWELTIAEQHHLQTAGKDFEFVAITPDWEGHIWFASYDSRAGFLNPATGEFTTLSLTSRPDETVANSISSCPAGIAVATTHALYVLGKKGSAPAILWQADYDRGNRVKPGKLSWGTGSSPTFFGRKTGYDYVTILDAGTSGTHLNIYHTKSGKLLSSTLAFEGDVAQGSENSPIAFGNSVVIASTYGFVYPAASRATEEEAELKKGIQRIDLLDDESGARVVWFNKSVRSGSVPKLGKDTKRIHFMNYAADEQLYYAELDFETGKEVCQSKVDLDMASALPNAENLTVQQKEKIIAQIGNPFNPLQMAGLYDGEGNLYQGTILGILKIAPARK